MDVVYHGIDLNEWHNASKPALDVQPGFIFAAGSIAPYRGFEDVIRSLALLRDRKREPVTAVFAGGSVGLASRYERGLHELAHSLGVEESIVWAGQLRRPEMTWCYTNASMFVQTSRAEACPNILLEALGHGCLCISCDQPPMPELVGDAAMMYRVGNAEQLANTIMAVQAMDDATREEFKNKARLRAAEFSCDIIAEMMLQILERVSDRSGR
jgi:glycosyltransferase involved in cell wall biosynthesis